MKKLAAIGALGLIVSSGLLAQGLTPPSGQTKTDWEEINFEFNSSILTDGYPSLLRLADLLSQHRDYRVKVTGNTDNVGSAAYNNKLAFARANTVRDFLVKYGASADQVTTDGKGKSDPTVDNKSKEGRFMNRRVVLTVTDGQGRLVKEGGISDVLNGMQEFMKKQEECCGQILKQLGKLDDILAALKNLQGENDKLRGEVADLRNQQNALRDQVNGLPKPLNEQQTTTIARNEAMGAVDEVQKRNKKFSLLGVNIGPTYGKGRTGDFSFSGRGQFFSPFGGEGTHAVQAQGEYMYYPGRQEGQFDIGLVNRWGNIQAGAFGSFKYLNFKQYQSGGGLGQAAFLADYIFSRGRIGVFGTKGFKNIAVLDSVPIFAGVYNQTYARVMDQIGASGLVGVWGNAYVEANAAYLKSHGSGRNRPGGMVRLVNPFSSHIAGTVEFGYNETFVNASDAGRVAFGIQFGNFIRPKDYRNVKTPVPMDVPRVRYEMLTRRVGSTPPVANAGSDQVGVAPGSITLNGSGSYDPLGLALTYSWTQVSGPAVSLSAPNQATTTFTGAAGQTYIFRLTVTNTDHLSGAATTTVKVGESSGGPQIVRFDASPVTIAPGQSTTLSWATSGASTASITGIGSVNPNGSTAVSPATTTTYTLTATNSAGQSVTAPVTVTVTAGSIPQVVTFVANPSSIDAGSSSRLCWQVNNATSVAITGIGSNLNATDCASVSPASTTTYTLTATNSAGTIQANATVNVGQVRILSFTATPAFSPASGKPVVLAWTTENAVSVVVTGSDIQPQTLQVNGSLTIYPQTDNVYTLTAYGAGGQTVSTTVSVNVR